jgi:hypothetical protein
MNDECDIITHEGAVCPVCGEESMSDEENRSLEMEEKGDAYDEYRAHGLPDDATYNPYTGWSAYDYPPRGSSRNDAGEPYLD